MLFYAEILAHDEEGALERILRVCRSRGYASSSLRAVCDPEQNVIHIEIEGHSERPLAQLSLQIEKLIDVIEVSVRILPASLPKLNSADLDRYQFIRRPVYASSSRG